jgi:molybdate transport system substrate-binding protein
VRRAALVVAALAAASCGGTDGGDADRLVVSAAASLTEPLTECSRAFDGAAVRLSFAGSDELAAQIRRGVRPDVFAAADTRLPGELAREGRVDRPRTFASNRLVVAVGPGSRLGALEDLARDGVTVAMGAASVPVGAYAREVLGRLDAATERRVLANVRTEEPDVKGVVGKVAQGAVDAGLVYATDVAATDGRLRAIELPPGLRPEVAYGAAVVHGAGNPRAARRYLDSLIAGGCRRALRDAGFGPPPAP